MRGKLLLILAALTAVLAIAMAPSAVGQGGLSPYYAANTWTGVWHETPGFAPRRNHWMATNGFGCLPFGHMYVVQYSNAQGAWYPERFSAVGQCPDETGFWLLPESQYATSYGKARSKIVVGGQAQFLYQQSRVGP